MSSKARSSEDGRALPPRLWSAHNGGKWTHGYRRHDTKKGLPSFNLSMRHRVRGWLAVAHLVQAGLYPTVSAG